MSWPHEVYCGKVAECASWKYQQPAACRHSISYSCCAASPSGSKVDTLVIPNTSVSTLSKTINGCDISTKWSRFQKADVHIHTTCDMQLSHSRYSTKQILYASYSMAMQFLHVSHTAHYTTHYLPAHLEFQRKVEGCASRQKESVAIYIP